MSCRMDSFRSVGELPVGVCRACGCGDNTIGHWTRWCVVPLMVVWISLPPLGQWQCLDDIATQSTTYNAICTLTVAAFSRLLRQEGAFYHQTPNEAKSIGWWIDTLLMAVAQDAPQELGVPFFGSIVMLSRSNTVSAILRDMQRNPPEFESNASIQVLHCTCGEYHLQVTLTAECAVGDVLAPGQFGDPKIFVQFDGSAHHDAGLGGAGAGLYEISAQGLQLMDWGSIALPQCKDNIVAEVMGADLACLYERYVKHCQTHNHPPPVA